MKNNLENAFKDKLSEFEAPYDPQAWEAVKGKLDAKANVGGNSSAWKWIAATAVVATIAVTSIVVFNPDETTTAKVNSSNTEETSTKDIDNSKAESKDETPTIDESENENKVDVNNSVEEAHNSGNERAIETIENTQDVTLEERNTSDENTMEAPTLDNNDKKLPVNIQATSSANKYTYISGNVSSNEVCAGEKVSVTNIGAKNQIVRFEINGEVKELKKAYTYNFQPENSVVINFKDNNGKIIDSEFIKVNELPNPDFRIEANIYEKGLPITICEAYGDYKEITWDFDGEAKKEGKKAQYNFFEKGRYDVSLTVTDFNGCVNTKKKEVRIDKQYNLMAVEAFIPNGSDPKTKAFMPFSLTQRDVPFTLTIIDPRDNSIVFTSKDASNAWNGIDERTGEMTDSETVFIWRVQLENSLPNERPVYAGTVVHK